MIWKRYTHLRRLRIYAFSDVRRLGWWCSFNIHFNSAPGKSWQLIQISYVCGAGCRSRTLVLFGAYFCIVDVIIFYLLLPLYFAKYLQL